MHPMGELYSEGRGFFVEKKCEPHGVRFTIKVPALTGWMYITLAKGQAMLQNTLHAGTADVRPVGENIQKVLRHYMKGKLLARD